MASRMEKYYKTIDSKRRIVRNEDLYQTIYEDETYSNIEGVVATPNANEINIEKIKELITSHENKKRQPRQLARKSVDYQPEIAVLDEEEKNYDIRDVLVKAKDSREENKDEYRSLKNTEYNILKSIKIDKEDKEDKEQEELKDLINTITNTSMLNKLGDKELSLDLLDELKSDTMIGEPSAINSLLKETKEQNNANTREMDTSFFTSSLNFKDKDFEQLQDLNKSINKNNKIIQIVLITLFVIVAIILVFAIYKIIIK